MLDKADLTKFDYQILQKVHDNRRILENDLLLMFPSVERKSNKLRIELLSTPDYRHINQISIPNENTSYLNKIYISCKDEVGFDSTKYTGELEISDLGIKALEDYKLSNKIENHKYWIRSVITPIGVALVTSVITTIATLSIKQWLSLYW